MHLKRSADGPQRRRGGPGWQAELRLVLGIALLRERGSLPLGIAESLQHPKQRYAQRKGYSWRRCRANARVP